MGVHHNSRHPLQSLRQGLFAKSLSQTFEAQGCASRAPWMASCVFAKGFWQTALVLTGLKWRELLGVHENYLRVLVCLRSFRSNRAT